MNMNDIFQRQIFLSEKSSKVPVITVKEILSNLSNDNVNIEPMLETFLKESSRNAQYADKFINKYILLMNEFYKKESPYFQTVFESFKNLVMHSKNQKDIKQIMTEKSLLPDQYINQIIEMANNNIVLDRVYNNNTKIKSRFKLNEITNNIVNDEDEDTIIESICPLINTYDMPIHKKITISLEETLYLYSRLEKQPNVDKLLESVLDYFLANENCLTDKDIQCIKSAIKENKFITEADTERIKFFTEAENVTAFDRLNLLAAKIENPSYKQCLNEIVLCSNVKEAEIVIPRVINKIYIIYGCRNESTLEESIALFKSLYGLHLTINSSSIYNIIKTSLDNAKIINNPKDNDEAKVRCEQLSSAMTEIVLNFNPDNCFTESSILLDAANVDNEMPDETIKYIDSDPDQLEDIFNIDFTRCLVTEEVVDSYDVKEAIDHYKAQEHKDCNALVRLVKSWYVKSAKNIIDETPHVLGFIRKFAVIVPPFIIPTIGPVLALISFIVDYFISQDINRKEADKMVKFFKHEKEIVEKQLKKAKSDNKDRLEKYNKELEKAILNIEQYRDNLYSEKELDRMADEELWEATCDKEPSYTLSEFFMNNRNIIAQNIDNALNDIEYALYNIGYDKDRRYKIASDDINEYFRNMNLSNISKFINQNGTLTIPLITLEDLTEDQENLIYDIVAKENHSTNIDTNHCRLSIQWWGNLGEGKTIHVIQMDVFQKIDTKYSPDLNLENNIIESDLQYCSNIMMITEMLQNIEQNQNILSEICENFDMIAMDENVEEIAKLVAMSNLDSHTFANKLHEAYSEIDVSAEPMQSVRLYNAYKCFDSPEKNNSLALESSIIDVLTVINEASKKKEESKGIMNILNKKDEKIKNNKKSKDKDKKIISASLGNIANKTKDGQVAITTNLGLAIEAMKKGVQNASEKEKELSTTLDSSMSMFKRSIEKSLTTDRREAIIKGSIIPSFSKCIKASIAAGVALKVNPILGAIGCIGALACSKALTKKERKLLLDEIDIELQVVNREIDNCGSDTSSAKYRELITYKKRLQRESQRIRYRIKVYSKEQIPSSEA